MKYQKMKKVQKIHNEIIQKQLQMRMIKKYPQKYISPEERQKNIDNLRSVVIV